MPNTVGTTLQESTTQAMQAASNQAAAASSNQQCLIVLTESSATAQAPVVRIPVAPDTIKGDLRAVTYQLSSYTLGMLTRARGRQDETISFTSWLPSPVWLGSSDFGQPDAGHPYQSPQSILAALDAWIGGNTVLSLTIPNTDFVSQVILVSREKEYSGLYEVGYSLSFVEYRQLQILTADEAKVPNVSPSESPGISGAIPTGQGSTFLIPPTTSLGGPPQPPVLIPRTYQIQPGDTPQSISQTVYHDDGQGQYAILQQNRDKIPDPAHLVPGMWITIPNGGGYTSPLGPPVPPQEPTDAAPAHGGV